MITVYEYVCGCPGRVHGVNEDIHLKIQGGKSFTCTLCNQSIRFRGKAHKFDS